MEIKLSRSWMLSTKHRASRCGIPVLVNRVTGRTFGPWDTVKVYPSQIFAPAREAVRRLAKTRRLTKADAALVSKFY